MLFSEKWHLLMNFCSEFLCVLHTITIDHLNKFRVKRNFCQTWKILQTTKLIILRNHEWNFSQQPYIMNFPKSLPSLPLREINQFTFTREKLKVFHFSLVKVNYSNCFPLRGKLTMISVVQTETLILIGWQKNSTAWKSRLRYMVRSESKLPWIRHFK